MNCVDSTLSFALRIYTEFINSHEQQITSWFTCIFKKMLLFLFGGKDSKDHKLHEILGANDQESMMQIKHTSSSEKKTLICCLSIKRNGAKLAEAGIQAATFHLSPRPSALGRSPRSVVYLLAAPAWNSPVSSSAQASSHPMCISETSTQAKGKWREQIKKDENRFNHRLPYFKKK